MKVRVGFSRIPHEKMPIGIRHRFLSRFRFISRVPSLGFKPHGEQERSGPVVQLGEQILVVEDNQDVRELIMLILSKEGYALQEAHDGLSALAIAREFKPKLILLDVMMPGISGLEVLQEIRHDKDKGVREALVLMITAKSQPQDIETALLYGATSYVIKPFRPAALIEKVHRLLHPPTLI